MTQGFTQDVNNTSVVDANNSSTAQMTNGQTFVGTGVDVEKFSNVTISINSDQDSAADGMKFQFSKDNTNWDDTNSFFLDQSESNARRFQFPVTAKYFRVNYTNGTSTTTTFRCQTMLHRTGVLTSIHRVSDTLTTDRSAELVRAVIAGETTAGGGSMVNVKVNPSGNVQIDGQIEGTQADSSDTIPNPVVSAGVARDFSTTLQEVSEDDVSIIKTSRGGSQFVLPGDVAIEFTSNQRASSGTTTINTPASGKKNVLMSYGFQVETQVTTDVDVTVKMGSTQLLKVAMTGGQGYQSPYGVLAVGGANDAITIATDGSEATNFWFTFFEVSS